MSSTEIENICKIHNRNWCFPINDPGRRNSSSKNSPEELMKRENWADSWRTGTIWLTGKNEWSAFRLEAS